MHKDSCSLAVDLGGGSDNPPLFVNRLFCAIAAGAEAAGLTHFMTTSICIAQLNFVAGDLSGNAQKVIEAAQQAHAQGAALLVTPELALCGYAAEDLLLRPAFQQASDEALQTVVEASKQWPGLTLLVGHAQAVEGSTLRRNAASWIANGQVLGTTASRHCPTMVCLTRSVIFCPVSRPV